jgi:flagellar biosynthetic protein FliR
MIDWSDLTGFLYITARMSGVILFNPILGRRSIPGIFRSGMILVLSVFVASVAMPEVSEPGSILELSLNIMLELALGFVLGMAVNFFFYIPQLAGLEIDTQMGMTMNQIYDAGAQANLSVTSEMINTLMTLLFFAANGHHTLLRLMLTSQEIVPFGQVHLGAEVANRMLELFVECTLLALKLCLPILAAEMIGQLGMGILMKVIPQINVFAINIELKIMIGLALLYLLLRPFSEFLLQTEITMLDSLQELLALSA